MCFSSFRIALAMAEHLICCLYYPTTSPALVKIIPIKHRFSPLPPSGSPGTGYPGRSGCPVPPLLSGCSPPGRLEFHPVPIPGLKGSVICGAGGEAWPEASAALGRRALLTGPACRSPWQPSPAPARRRWPAAGESPFTPVTAMITMATANMTSKKMGIRSGHLCCVSSRLIVPDFPYHTTNCPEKQWGHALLPKSRRFYPAAIDFRGKTAYNSQLRGAAPTSGNGGTNL